MSSFRPAITKGSEGTIVWYCNDCGAACCGDRSPDRCQGWSCNPGAVYVQRTATMRAVAKTATAAAVLALLLACATVAYGGTLDLPVTPPHLLPEPEKKPKPAPPPEPEKPSEDPRDAPPPVFFGEEIYSQNETIVFVLDHSYSLFWASAKAMPPGTPPSSGPPAWYWIKEEAIRSIQGLSDNFQFNVVLFGCGPVSKWPGLQPATIKNKNAAARWIRAKECSGGTGTGYAVAMALADKSVRKVVLLTDGSPGCALDANPMRFHRQIISGANTQHASIDVFGLGLYPRTRSWCQRVAHENNGSFYEVR